MYLCSAPEKIQRPVLSLGCRTFGSANWPSQKKRVWELKCESRTLTWVRRAGIAVVLWHQSRNLDFNYQSIPINTNFLQNTNRYSHANGDKATSDMKTGCPFLISFSKHIFGLPVSWDFQFLTVNKWTLSYANERKHELIFSRINFSLLNHPQTTLNTGISFSQHHKTRKGHSVISLIMLIFPLKKTHSSM